MSPALSQRTRAALAALIEYYNIARAAWLTYRGAIATNAPSDTYFSQLTKNVSDLSNAIRAFMSGANASPTGRSQEREEGK